jgi:hypothetical protein
MRTLIWIGWLSFALLVILGGRLTLAACEFRPAPLFGYAYCPRYAPPAALDAEAERERALRSRLRSAEARFAALPFCQPPSPSPAANQTPPRPQTQRRPQRPRRPHPGADR